jgi:nucleoside-diphosphate-sugar epimerase
VWRLLAGGHAVTLFNRGTLADSFGQRVQRVHGDRTTDAFDRALAGRRFDAAVDFAGFAAADVERAVRVLQGRVGHYVFISTGQVYLVREPRPAPARETDYEGTVMREPPPGHPDHGDWAYGVGKRACEDALAQAFAGDGFPATRLRVPVINGERDHTRRLEGYLWRLLDGGPVLLPDGGTHRLRHVYGRDVSRTIAGLLGQPRTFGQAYNLCQDEMPTLAELVEMLAGLLGAAPRLCPVARAAVEAAGLDPVRVSPFSGGGCRCSTPPGPGGSWASSPRPCPCTSAPSRPASWPIRRPPRPTPTPTAAGSSPWPEDDSLAIDAILPISCQLKGGRLVPSRIRERRAPPRAQAEAPRRNVVLTRAALRAADLLGLPRKDLAVVLGVSPSTLSRLDERPLDPARKEGELAVLFVRLFRSLDALLGGQTEKARQWLHAPNRHLGGIPAERIRTVTGLVDAIEYLDAMRGKV